MKDQPSNAELIEATQGFLTSSVSEHLSGHDAYSLRVALNVLETVKRDVLARPEAERDEAARLRSILDIQDASLDELNADFCDGIRSKKLDPFREDIWTHLKKTTIEQVKIDQPKYSGLKTALST